MPVEAVQDLVRIKLELDGYFVRSNVRFKVGTSTPTGKSAAYSDLDIVAVRVDPNTGAVAGRIWGEIKAHLTLSLTANYLRDFPDDYAVMLDLSKFEPAHASFAKWKGRQDAAIQAAATHLGAGFRRVLYFGGKKPQDGGVSAKELLDPSVEVVYIRDFAKAFVRQLGHQEGSEPLVRVINMLKAYGLVAD